MRSFITTMALVLATPSFFACDDGEATTPGVTAAPAREAGSDVCDGSDPMALASCHAAYNDAMDRIEGARAEAAVCEVDSDCTITVTETRCTGEFVSAVNATAEAGFLGFVDRVDARLCAGVAACDGSGDEDPEALSARCVASRCAIAE
jgi:hypothetical protein